jgi:predicted metallopeptidase
MGHINLERVDFFRTYGSKTRAQARIWALPGIWLKALGITPRYVIEVIANRYDCLPDVEKEKVIIHELLHIPAKFSGGIVPHLCFGKRIDRRRVDELHRKYCANSLRLR